MAINQKHNLVKLSIGEVEVLSRNPAQESRTAESGGMYRIPSPKLSFESSTSSTSCGAMARSGQNPRLQGLRIAGRDRNSDVKRMADGDPVIRAQGHDTAQNHRCKSMLAAKT